MDLPLIELSGTPGEMGEAFGALCRRETRELYAVRLDRVLSYFRNRGQEFSEELALSEARKCLGPTEAYDPVSYSEFTGIARSAELLPEQLFLMQGLSDFLYLVIRKNAPPPNECSSFIAGAARTESGRMLIGQNWDFYTDNIPYVRLVRRKPKDDPATVSLTLTGCLSLTGINSEGISVGTTNLTTSDVRYGVQYMSVLHRALRSVSFEEAVESIISSPRAGAHYYFVGAREGRAAGLECSAQRAARIDFDGGIFVHTNHALRREIGELAGTPRVSTLHRAERLKELLESRGDKISIQDIKDSLSDHEGGQDRCLCTHDYEGSSTAASVIMSPDTGEIHACRSQPHVGKWVSAEV